MCRFARLFVNVGFDRRPEGVDDVHAERHEEEVEQDLGVVAEYMGEAGMTLDEMEDGGDETHLVRRGTLGVYVAVGVPSR